MTNRTKRAAVAAETLEIIKQGYYQLGKTQVSIDTALAFSRQQSRLYRPSDLQLLIDALPASVDATSENSTTLVSVVNASTFSAARQLLAEGFNDVFCLNFASAKNPGGGFISGAQAQEECLARASGLYSTLLLHPEYYEANHRCGSSVYTHHAIYSPKVPVFRDYSDQLLESPYQVSMLTMPAVNAGAVRQNEADRTALIETHMRDRIDMALAIAQAHGHRALVLGAWGCGVFGNSPHDVARWFYDALNNSKTFATSFERVVFAVLDQGSTTTNFSAFAEIFRAPGRLQEK
jgi:uncharacterized protein (TIGR02452 family)